MNRPAITRQLEPDSFCLNDGAETGIRVREGYDLCLECWRAYRAALAAPRGAQRAVGGDDLFGRVA